MLVITLASLAFAADGDPPPTDDPPTEDTPTDDAPTDDAPAEDSAAKAAKKAARGDRPGLLDERAAPPGVLLSVRGIGEMWHDPYLSSRFRTGGLAAGVGMVVPLTGLLAIDAEIAYHRSTASTGEGTLQLAPFSLLAVGRLLPSDDGGLELFGGLGPAMIMWSESGQGEAYMRELAEDPDAPVPTVLRGARPGLELRLGLRVDLGLTQASLNPTQRDPVQAVSLEIQAGRRFATTSSGFNFNTWRVGAGLAARF